jgi:hypothetical protein
VQHLTDDHLEDYLLAKIPGGIELILVEDHLFRCQRCFARFQRTETYFRVMDVDLNASRKRPLWEMLTESARRGLVNLGLLQRSMAS